MHVNSTTGLTCEQEDEIVARYQERFGAEFSARSRGRILSLKGTIILVLTYLRTNMSQQALAEFFKVSQPTVSRSISLVLLSVKKLVQKETKDRESYTRQEGTCLADGTLIPTWNWRYKQGIYSGKHKRKGFNLQISSSLDGLIFHAGKPVPGSTHDMKAFTRSGLRNKLAGMSIYADLGYYGSEAKTPIKKPQFRKLSDVEKHINKEHAQQRSPVERCIAHIKNWKILSTTYRCPLYKLKSFIETIIALEIFRTSHQTKNPT